MLKIEAYNQLKNECDNNSVNLIAVSEKIYGFYFRIT